MKMKREDSTLSDSKASSVGYKRTPTGLRNRTSAATAHQRTMAEQSAEGIPEPKEIHNWLVYVVGLSMCMSAMAYGYDTGFFGGTLALPSFARDFGDTTTSKATMVSLFKAGSFFGTALQLPFTEAYGRKKSVALAIFIFIASAFPQIFAAGSVPVFTVGFLWRVRCWYAVYLGANLSCRIFPCVRQRSLSLLLRHSTGCGQLNWFLDKLWNSEQHGKQ